MVRVPLPDFRNSRLAAAEFLKSKGQRVELASYDERLTEAARLLGIAIAAL